jgi:GNAT superfamily N-acetyltransferase
VFVTRHSNVVDLALRERLWRLYDLAYRGMSERAVTRESYYRSEFDDVLLEPTNRIWVLWRDDEPIAMTVIATDVAATRYLSRAYFETRYSEHVLRGVVHYILWVVVHPLHEAKGVLVRLARDVIGLEADEGALLVFDAPEINQPADRGGIAELMQRLASMVSAGTPVAQIEVQRYYAVDFAQGVRAQMAELDEQRSVEVDASA